MDKGCQVFLAHVMGKEVGKEAIGGCAHHSRFSRASALQVLRRLGSIFTSVYAAKLKRVVSLLEENKFEGDNTPIVIQPPCYSASKLVNADTGPRTCLKKAKTILPGSLAGFILINLEGMEFTYALWFAFDASNNEAEYEALVVGLRIAEQMGVKNVEAKVPRSENKKAYVLIKIASTSFAHLTKQVLVDVLEEKSIEEKEILFVVEEEGYSWMTPLFEYLTDGTLPAEAKKVQAIKIKSRQYAIGFRRLQDDSKNELVLLNSKGDHPPPKRIVDGVEQTYPPTTAKEKLARKNELKARVTLFRGNIRVQETQKTLLKQQYKNFNGSSSEGLDQTYDKLQKLISQLEILGKLECRAPRENRNKEPIRRNVIMETTETKTLVAQDGLGYDWSLIPKGPPPWNREGPTNFALMAYTSSGSSSSSSSDSEVSSCFKACLKSYETLKEHYDNLTKDFNKSQLNVGAYKAGLESVEARLDMYKKNEVVFEEDIKILKLDIKLRDNALIELRKKFEKVKKERDDLKLTLEKFGNSSKNLSKLLEIQVSDKFKTGVGFDSQVVDSHVFDSQENERYKTSDGNCGISFIITRGRFLDLASF
ncbi:hypothetical protein Tco_0715533 [Tanacetum coccineum]